MLERLWRWLSRLARGGPPAVQGGSVPDDRPRDDAEAAEARNAAHAALERARRRREVDGNGGDGPGAH